MEDFQRLLAMGGGIGKKEKKLQKRDRWPSAESQAPGEAGGRAFRGTLGLHCAEKRAEPAETPARERKFCVLFHRNKIPRSPFVQVYPNEHR